MLELTQLDALTWRIPAIPKVGQRIGVVPLPPLDPFVREVASWGPAAMRAFGYKDAPRSYALSWHEPGRPRPRFVGTVVLEPAGPAAPSEVGRLSEGERLRLELERRGQATERTRGRELRTTIKAAKAERSAGRKSAAALCRTERQATTAAAQDARARLRAELEARRAEDRGRCVAARQSAAVPTAQIDRARAELTEALERRRTERRWKGQQTAPQKRSSARDARAESDDRVRSELPAELQPVWDRHKRRFAEGEHRSRLEAFQEWAAENRADVDAEVQRDLEGSIDRLLASEASHYEDREAAEGVGAADRPVHAENAAAMRQAFADQGWPVGPLEDADGGALRFAVTVLVPDDPKRRVPAFSQRQIRTIYPGGEMQIDRLDRPPVSLSPEQWRDHKRAQRAGRGSSGVEGLERSEHHVTIEPDPRKPGSFMVRNQRGHVFLHAASLESARDTARDLRATYRYEIHDHSGREDPRGPGAVLLEWGAAENGREGHGWLPQLWENGKQTLDSWASRGLDSESDALAVAEHTARKRVDRYSGDWMITLRRRA